MIDEFQDTNLAQIELIKLILNKEHNICVVGDDSQSIYGWRGADIEYILNFDKSFENVRKINLTKNYRSTENILNAANTLIDKASEKHEFKKALVAFHKKQGKIKLVNAYNEFEEAENIAKQVKKLLDKGGNPEEIAILYRSNMISSLIEQEFIKKKIPYQILKGRALLQKKVIQDFMSFLQLIINPKNSIALENALQSKAKLMSKLKIEEAKTLAKERGLSFTDFIFSGEWEKMKLTKPQKVKITSFIIQVDKLKKLVKEGLDMTSLLLFFEENFPLIKEYQKEIDNSKSITTVETATKALKDLGIFFEIAKSYSSLEEFVDDISLNDSPEEEEKKKVSLLTMHASKGLEFKYVFLARMNQGVIPTSRSIGNLELLEEERRLAYVAITRAKKFLYISYVKFQRRQNLTASQFLFESGLLKPKGRYF